MKNFTILGLLLLLSFNLSADESLTSFINEGIDSNSGESAPRTPTKRVHYKDSEGRFIDISAQKKLDIMRPLNDKKRLYVPSTEKRARYNESFAVLGDDKRIVEVSMSTNDVLKTQMCYNSPLRISFAAEFEDKMAAAIADDSKLTKADILDDKRSVLVSMISPIKSADEVWRTGVRIVRLNDGRAYNIQIEMIACPEGEIDFPREIIIKNKASKDYSEDTMLPEDLISTLTYGLPRVNTESPANIYSGIPTENAEWILLGVSIKIRNPLRETGKFEFIVLDRLQLKVLNSDVKFIPTSSIFATDSSGIPTLRFNLMVKVDKKYAIEKNFINLLIVDHDQKSYQHLKVHTKNLYFEKSSIEGYELNLK